MQRLNRPVSPWVKHPYLPHTQSMCGVLLSLRMRAQRNWGEPLLPEGNLLSKGINWVELRKHMTNCPIHPGKGLPLLNHPSHWHQCGVWVKRKRERGKKKKKKKKKRKREARRQQYGAPSPGRNCWERGEAFSLLPSLALNPMCLSTNLGLIQDIPLEDTRRPAPTSMRPPTGFKKRTHPLLLPSCWLGRNGREWLLLLKPIILVLRLSFQTHRKIGFSGYPTNIGKHIHGLL